MVMVIQIVAAVLLVLGSALVFRALVELDRPLAGPSRSLRAAKRSTERAGELPRAA